MTTRMGLSFLLRWSSVVVAIASCGDATGPDAEFMMARLNGTPWAAERSSETHPFAWVAGGRLGLTGYGGRITIELTDAPAAVGVYVIGDESEVGTARANLLTSRGTIGSPDFQWLRADSDTGEVTIDALDGEWVSGTFWFRAEGNAGATVVSEGTYRLRLE